MTSTLHLCCIHSNLLRTTSLMGPPLCSYIVRHRLFRMLANAMQNRNHVHDSFLFTKRYMNPTSSRTTYMNTLEPKTQDVIHSRFRQGIYIDCCFNYNETYNMYTSKHSKASPLLYTAPMTIPSGAMIRI